MRYLSKLAGEEIPAFENSPEGSDVTAVSFTSSTDQLVYLDREIMELVKNQGVEPSQVVIFINGSKSESCLAEISRIAGLHLIGLGNNARFHVDAIHYSTIDRFKGLECDIAFVLVPVSLSVQKMYTIASRARFKISLLQLSQSIPS